MTVTAPWPSPLDFFARLKWIDGRALMDTIEPYRREIFLKALYTFRPDGAPVFNMVVNGRGKKNNKSSDLIFAGLFISAAALATDKQTVKTLSVRKIGCSRRAAVMIAPSLRRQSPQNGNIPGRGRRLSAVGAPKSANWESEDEIECAKSRYFRPFFTFFRNCSRALDCLADLGGFELRYSQS